ncbi:hypothetical protein PF001_g14819 [Phytophthora fragariae]|uniref:ABC transporter domain-containing protein n=1 Tax=Phytophthora fragariae TaxID=53985 RepID=A0A6A4D7S1_9STRA|nr:hypothetical protein PF001_g14819 [Phytophthora fragariae]
MPTARRSARNSKRRPSSSRKSKPPPSMEFSTSISSVSSEPTPILESSLASSYQKHVLRRHQPTSRTSRRPGPRDSPFTPRRPVGAVPELFVTFRHVSLAVDIPVSPAAAAAAAQAASGQMGRETLAAKQLPTISNHVRGIAAGLTASKTFVRRQILKNVTGAFTPGSMTLLLGRSGSGKSVLLKLLGGRLDVRANGVTTDGEVSYNGLTRQELKQQLPQCVAYVPQQDTHLPVMTVKETLDFAFECCAINAGARPVGSVSKSPALEHPLALPTTYLGGERDPVTVTRELGLTRCQGTIVGDERLRGVSGGEKKRVTTGEMAFGPHAVSLMDEITTGLDSSAAFDVVNAQRRLARQQRQTVVISLQQPAPEVLALFDNVLLLADGEVLYHGPRAHIQAYFEALGFVCPPERGLADFLCDLASPQQLQYERSHAPMPGRRRHPRSANEFADLWIMSPMYEAMVEELDHLDNDTEAYSHTHSKNGEWGLYFDQEALLQVPPFRQSYLRSTWTVMKRQLRLFVRNKVFFAGRVLLDLLVGLMLGSMYYGMDLADSQVTLGVVFSCTLFLGLGQSATLAPFFDAREVFYKHRGANFYRTSSYVLASYASQLPLAITEAFLFSGLVYWMGGFVSSVEHFLVFVLYMLLTILVFIGEYFFLAAACSSLHVAQPASTLALLFFILFAGFAVSREQLPSAMRWIYWSNPLAWATRGVLVSQYRSSELDVCVYGGIDYCKTYEGQTLGEYSLGLYDVPSDPKWVMLGLVFLLAVYVGSMLLSYVMLEYRRHESSPALPPPLPASYSDTIPTPRQPKESYAMLSTPHGEDDELLESDITGFLPPDGRVLGANGDSSDSFNASQGVHTDPGDIMVRLMPRWEVPPVTLAFQDLRYSITVPADAVSEGQSGVEGAPGRPVSVDSRAKAGKSKEMVTRELLKGVTGYALPGTMTALMGSTGAGKTTLMDVLAGRKSGKGGAKKNGAPCLRGRVLLNGVDATELAVRRCTGNDFTSYQGANGAVGLIFFSTCFLGVGAYVHVLPLAFEERRPFYRERASETYSALWYFAASSVVEIPCAALASLIFVGVFYPMAGFSAHGDFAQVVVYWLVLTVHILFQTYFGQFFTFAMPSIELAAVWGSLFDSIFLMFMGYNPPVSSIPDGYKWLFQIVPHRYTFEVLTALVLGDCPDAQLQQIQDAAASNTTIDVSQWPLGCQPLTDAPPAVANIPLTSYIDAVFGARREDTARSVAVVVGVLLAMRAATLIVMRIVNHQKR